MGAAGGKLETWRELERNGAESREREARRAPGENPRVPQLYPVVTQYTALKWTARNEVIETLKQTAEKGSLCCMLYLAAAGVIGQDYFAAKNAQLLSAVDR